VTDPAPLPSELERAIEELDRAAARLRSGELDADEAAALVERCAELAADVTRALEREARAARAAPPPGQETLL
jgi:exonuclease VII small subunit